jgi:hypothetical protein
LWQPTTCVKKNSKFKIGENPVGPNLFKFIDLILCDTHQMLT